MHPFIEKITQKPFTIAEVGINHNGDINIAKKMIDAAKASGVNAVKFQTFQANEFVGDPTETYTYKSQGKEITESMLTMFQRYQFSGDDWQELYSYCQQQKIQFLSTPQNYSDCEILLKLGVEALKVGSDDFTNIPLLKQFAATGLPLMLSIGMADLAEVYESLNAVNAIQSTPTVLMLCTSQYPTPSTDVNINKLDTIKQAFPNVVLGFSDHTKGQTAAVMAVTKGALVFEKHFTLDNTMAGPDHWFSENPSSLKTWVEQIQTAYKMLGSSEIVPTQKELEMRKLARRSITALTDIKKGELLTECNVGLRRPGHGLEPKWLTQVIGKKATKAFIKNDNINLGDFSHST